MSNAFFAKFNKNKNPFQVRSRQPITKMASVPIYQEFKVLVLGDSGVGKTSIIQMLASHFQSGVSTLIQPHCEISSFTLEE